MDRDTVTLDGDKIKRDLTDYYGTAMAGGFPMAVADLSKVENASDKELIRMAFAAGFDLSEYLI